MKNLVIAPLALAAVMFLGSCQMDDGIIIEDDPKVDIPFDPENENDLPSDTGGFSGFVGEGFNIKLDTMINDLPTDVDGFNPVSVIENFQTNQSNDDLVVSFYASNNLSDKYTFMVYNFETQEIIGGFKLRGGADLYNYTVKDLPTETDLILWGWIDRGFGQEYLGGVWVNLDSNI